MNDLLTFKESRTATSGRQYPLHHIGEISGNIEANPTFRCGGPAYGERV
jgi:hypothetical protein